MNLTNIESFHPWKVDRASAASSKILIIDDEPLNVALLEDMLSEVGYTQIKSVTDSRVAVEACASFEPDLILLDWLMPHLNGLAVLKGVRALESEIYLPVIVLTAAVSEEAKLRALQSRASDYLLKPFDQIEVLLRIANLLEIRHLFIHRRRIELELQREKERALEANAAKDRFLATVSHELRTPLNPILLWVGGTLATPGLDPELEEGLQMVDRNIKLEAGIIDDLLDVTGISRGKVELHSHTGDMHEILGRVIEIVRGEIEARHLRLFVALEASSHLLRVDARRIHQVFWNLLRNACKFTPEGGAIWVRSYNPDARIFCVEIRDNGVGMAPQFLDKIFDPFEQLDSRRGGLGLGLAISKAIVEMHGGTIRARSDGLGRGTAFEIELRTTVSGTSASSMAEGCSTARPGIRRILYIEDNLSNLALVEEILRDQSGLELMSVMRGQLGLDLARKHLPDLILLDLHLPDLHGEEVLARLQSDETARHIPVVVLSADTAALQIERLLAAGARAYLTKPIDVAEFLRVVEETT